MTASAPDIRSRRVMIHMLQGTIAAGTSFRYKPTSRECLDPKLAPTDPPNPAQAGLPEGEDRAPPARNRCGLGEKRGACPADERRHSRRLRMVAPRDRRRWRRR